MLAGGLLTLLFTQFNNCGNYADPAVNLSSTSVLDCSTSTTCILSNVDNLKVTPHLGNGQYGVNAGLTEFNIAGDCNEGGFPINLVHWTLGQGGQVFRSSDMILPSTGRSMESTCINGHFSIYVYLGAISGDPADRRGLQLNGPGSARTSYDLNVIIRGQQVANGPYFQSPQSTSLVPLVAN